MSGEDPIFTPFTINGVEFPNRLVRSSIGGRYAYYDGTVNPAWAHFERRFAEHGIGAIVSATLTVNDRRWAPLEYPKISQDRFVEPIAARPLRDWWFGNDIDTTLAYGRRLKDLGVDYLHVSNGFGFINPKENPGAFPAEEIRAFFNSTRHLSAKAAARSTLLNLMPAWLRQATGVGWRSEPGANLADAARFRREVGLPVIANGGFQQRSLVERALSSGGCDLVSMARPLLANPDLPELFREGRDLPERPCTFCNRCALRTTIAPLGCYEPARFDSREQMEQQILGWSSPHGPSA